MASRAGCGAPFQLDVSSTGGSPLNSVGDLDPVSVCTQAAPATTCTDAGAVVTAAHATASGLGALVHSLGGPWPQALSALGRTGNSLRTLRASTGLPSGSEAARAVTAAEIVVTAAATVTDEAEQQSSAARAALAQARSVQATDESFPGDGPTDEALTASRSLDLAAALVSGGLAQFALRGARADERLAAPGG